MGLFERLREGGKYKAFIAGSWRLAKSLKEVRSPLDGSLIGETSALSKEEVDEAFNAAEKAFQEWRATPLNERVTVLTRAARILEEHKDELARVMHVEIAKPYKSCLSEVERSADLLRFTAAQAATLEGELYLGDAFPKQPRKKLCITYREPLGVILAISPFNYPVNLSISKIAPAIAGGNAVVLKPPSQGSISALHLGPVFEEAGLPPGVLNIVTGKGSEIGDYLATHPAPKLITFTGSTSVGKRIASIAGMKKLLFELGGKDPAIVLEDADLKLAAKHIVTGAYSYNGQRCTAVKRVIALKRVADELARLLREEVAKLSVGRGNEEVTPLIDEPSAERVEALIKEALEKGAVLLHPDELSREGNLLKPVLLDKVTPDMKVAWEEPFGPVLPLLRTDSLEEAVELANESGYGLQAAVFTKDLEAAFKAARLLEAGTVQINGKTERGPDNFPFLGVKDSGIGVQGVKNSLLEMTRPKNIVLNLEGWG